MPVAGITWLKNGSLIIREFNMVLAFSQFFIKQLRADCCCQLSDALFGGKSKELFDGTIPLRNPLQATTKLLGVNKWRLGINGDFAPNNFSKRGLHEN